MATVYQIEQERQKQISWQVPPHDADPRRVQQWAESFIEQGGKWLENTRAAKVCSLFSTISEMAAWPV